MKLNYKQEMDRGKDLNILLQYSEQAMMKG